MNPYSIRQPKIGKVKKPKVKSVNRGMSLPKMPRLSLGSKKRSKY